jgi:hypothetical protein
LRTRLRAVDPDSDSVPVSAATSMPIMVTPPASWAVLGDSTTFDPVAEAAPM